MMASNAAPPKLMGTGNKRSSGGGAPAPQGGRSAASANIPPEQRVLAELRHIEQDESCRVQQALIKREELELEQRKAMLLSEHKLLLREVKRIADEQ